MTSPHPCCGLVRPVLAATAYHRHSPPPGKIIDCTATRTALGWQPKYKTFGAFIDTLV